VPQEQVARGAERLSGFGQFGLPGGAFAAGQVR